MKERKTQITIHDNYFIVQEDDVYSVFPFTEIKTIGKSDDKFSVYIDLSNDLLEDAFNDDTWHELHDKYLNWLNYEVGNL